MASVIRGDDNFDSLIHQGLGVNQTWQNITASRVAGVTYTNTTGKPIFVALNTVGYTNSCRVYIDGVYIFRGNTTNTSSILSFIVPNESIYKIVIVSDTVEAWSELR